MSSVTPAIPYPARATRRVGVPQLLLAIVACNVPALLRDTFDWPFYAERIYLFNAYILILALIIDSVGKSGGELNYFAHMQTRVRASTVFAAALLTAVLIVREVTSVFPSFIFICQWIQFLILILYLKSFASSDDVRRTINAFILVMVFATVFQVWVVFVKQAGNIAQLQRNELPYMALFSAGLAYAMGYRRKVVALLLLATVVSTVVNSTRGVVVASVVMIALFLFERQSLISGSVMKVLAALGLGCLVVAPILSPLLLMATLELPGIEELSDFETFRYHVPDAAASPIARIYGAVFALNALVESHEWLGLGERAVNLIKYWGYPVHNLFVLAIASYGVAGLAIALYLLKTAFSVATQSLMLAGFAIFTLSVANDLYLWLALIVAIGGLPRFRPMERGLRRRP